MKDNNFYSSLILNHYKRICFILEVDPHLAQEQEQSKLTPKGE